MTYCEGQGCVTGNVKDIMYFHYEGQGCQS